MTVNWPNIEEIQPTIAFILAFKTQIFRIRNSLIICIGYIYVMKCLPFDMLFVLSEFQPNSDNVAGQT